VDLEWGTWQVPAIFELIAEMGDIADDEMARVFNMGIGMAVMCDQATADDLIRQTAGASLAGTVQASGVAEKVRILR
jgi:phosphoribosylformylglycinamidine cyclo-ligase